MPEPVASDQSSNDMEKAVEPEPVPPATPQLPPEEGLRGWLCVVGSFICLFVSFGFLNAIGVFQTTYQETTLRDYGPSEISWIFAVQLCLMWLPGSLYGRIVDTYGPAPILYPASILCVLGLCMTSLAHHYYNIFLAQGLAFGIGAGGLFTASMVCVGQWFVRRRGLATGIAAAGSSLGGVIFPFFVNEIKKEIGFDGAVRYTALFMGILLAGACFMVTSRLPRKKWDTKAKWFDISLFKQKEFTLFTFGSFLVMWGLWAPFDFIASMAQNAGFSPDLALYLIAIINATSIFGRTIPPHLADTFGHFNVVAVCTCAVGVSILALWLPFNYHPSHAGIIIFALVYGFVSGAFVSLLVACVAKLGDIRTIGQRFGTFQLTLSISCLTGLPIMGAILDRQHLTDFSGLQIFGGTVSLVGSVMIAAAAYYLSKIKGTWKV